MLKRFSFFIVILLMSTATAILSGWAYLYGSSSGKILPGVTCAGVTLGGLTPDQAEKALKDKYLSLDKQNLILVGNQQQWEIKMSDLKANYGYHEAVQKAYNIGRQGPVSRRVTDLLKNQEQSFIVQLPIVFDEDSLKEKLEKIRGNYYKPAQNARLTVKNQSNQVASRAAVTGQEMDITETTRRILALTAGSTPTVTIAAKTLYPSVRNEDIFGLTQPLGKAVTYFEEETPERLANMAMALNRLDGSIVKPGGVFSFNQRIAPMNKKGGYKKAPVIISEEMVFDYSGGICQVSTTLYQAALISGMEIMERHANPVPVSYSSPGMEAIVGEGKWDLKFRNNTSRPIYISASVDLNEGQVAVNIIGGEGNQRTYRIEPEVTDIPQEVTILTNASLEPGDSSVIEEGFPGYEALIYRVTLNGGKVVKRELISHDHYEPEPTVIEEGPSDDE